jgi:glycine/D-amino acid oxidase-like deaminating enzyme
MRSKDQRGRSGERIEVGLVEQERVNALLSKVFDVAIVGAGITGSAAAYNLSLAGVRVVLLDRNEVGTEASGRNAGSLHGQIQHQPFVDLGERWASNFLPALAFLNESLKLWAVLSEELGFDLEVKCRGGLLLVDNVEQMRLVERKVAVERAAGIDSELLDQAELRECAPYVSPLMIGAEFCPIEGKANPMLVAPAFTRAAVTSGAEVLTRANVLSIEQSPDEIRIMTNRGTVRAKQVVLTSGDGLAEQVRTLGLRLPISTEPVQVCVTEPLMPLIEHLVYFAGQRLTLKQARAGSLLIGGGWPARIDAISGFPLVNLESLRGNLAVALHVVPALGRALVIRSWAGVGNGTPDHRPVIGALPGSARIHLGLFPHMGFTAGPLMGRVLANLALGLEPEVDLEPFKVDRFSSN